MTAPTLLVAMLQETGHLNPSFKLTRALKARGHDVRYLASTELTPYVAAQGFESRPFFPEPEHAAASESGALALLRKRRAITARYLSISERLVRDGAQAFGPRPALALVDVTQTHVALWARFFGIPLVLLNTSLPQTKAPGVAPLRSGLPFASGPLGRLRSELAWRAFLARRRLGALAADALEICPPYELSRQLAPRFGVSAAELDCETVYMPQLKGPPELVFCPEQLDFPRPRQAGRHYIESIELARSEPSFAWDRLPRERPIVYCALGGQLYRARETPTFFRRVLRAFAARPALTLVLATGRHMRPEQLEPHPPNVIVVERAPQLGLLARASAMITHGGLGSVKECVAHGVPMLVFPLDVDQPGNAARVVHHGLGLVGDIEETSARTLGHMLDRLLTEPSFAARCASLRETLRRTESSERGADLVDHFLREPAALQRFAAPARP